MKMRSITVFLVLVVGVLTEGSLGLDVQCFAEKEVELSNKMGAVRSISEFCSEVKPIANEVMNHAKTCGFVKTDVSGINSFVDEFCDADSDLRKKFDQSKLCLLENSLNILDCTILLNVTGLKENKEGLGQRFKHFCKDNVFDQVFGCINKALGEPCGDDGLQVVKGCTDAYSSYMNSVCSEINSSSSIE